jgi:hypothetical protein
MANRTTRTPEKDAKFLEALNQGASIAAAARLAGYGRRSIYEWRAQDAEFAAACEEALECGTDLLEDEALRRAKDGIDEPKFYEGDVCGHVRRYSDTLMIFLLKARRPGKYKERAEITGQDGAPLLNCIEVRFIKPEGDGSRGTLAEATPSLAPPPRRLS